MDYPKYLTLFTIGPVQSFIAKARKLQDLYAGSFLLSYLTKKTLHQAREKGAEVIFPNPDIESAPNRFLITVNCENLDALREFCSELEAYVRDEWEIITKTVLGKLNLEYSDAVRAQTQSLLQVFYASEPYESGEDYGQCYLNVIKRIGSAKMLRSFAQLDEGAGRKCDLMHEYNALFYRDAQNFIVQQAQMVTEKNMPAYKLDKYIQHDSKRETLSAPAFIKRCLKFAIDEFNDDFPSVTDVYKMHGDNYNEDDDKHGYYAVVMFDGDNMGTWYSEPGIVNKAQTEQFQAYLSGKISKFAAEESRKTVDWKSRKNGVLIYAGGEDFLGVLNIKDAFSTLKLLRDKFAQINLNPYSEKKLTFSAGVVLAHVEAPLSEVLNRARSAESKAKSNTGKDAFCLTIAKRSGEVTEFVLPFFQDGCSTLNTLDRLVEIIVNDGLSTKFIYQIGVELERISETENFELQKDIFLAETRRLINNSDFSEKSMKTKLIEEVCGLLRQLVESTNLKSIKNSLMYLRAVAFIARERGAV